jgi:hypothetical protein
MSSAALPGTGVAVGVTGVTVPVVDGAICTREVGAGRGVPRVDDGEDPEEAAPPLAAVSGEITVGSPSLND